MPESLPWPVAQVANRLISSSLIYLPAKQLAANHAKHLNIHLMWRRMVRVAAQPHTNCLRTGPTTQDLNQASRVNDDHRATIRESHPKRRQSQGA
jgi:hypothetical protein